MSYFHENGQDDQLSKDNDHDHDQTQKQSQQQLQLQLQQQLHLQLQLQLQKDKPPLPAVPSDVATTSSTASEQHKQEQELLSSYTVPNPPISTQQSSIAAEKESGYGHIDPPRTLWMGDLDPWLEEQGIADLWWQVLKKQVSVKIIKPKLMKSDLNLPNFQNSLTHLGYCFIQFETFDDAQQALSLNGQLLPDMAMPSQQSFPNNPDNQKKYFRLNWASGATLSAPIIQTPEYSLFVGDLSASTTEAHLLTLFQKHFPNSIKTVRVMTDPISGKSRCFGFVRFTDESERQKALVEMNGVWFGGRPLRVALATPRNQNKMKFPNLNSSNIQPPQQQFYGQPQPPSQQQYYGQPQPPSQQDQQFYEQQQQFFDQQQQQQQQDFYMPLPPRQSHYYYGNQLPPHQSQYDESDNQFDNQLGNSNLLRNSNSKSPLPNTQGQPFTDPTNTTVFVGGLSSDVSETTLFTLFKPFGTIQQVKIPPGKNCGFIKYSTREEAEEAISAMQGFMIGDNRVRLSWGRVSVNNKKFQQQQQQVAQAAQLQAAAALSMGLDPASAIAAAAAAAAGGYPPPIHQGMAIGMPPMPPPGVGLPMQFNQRMSYGDDNQSNDNSNQEFSNYDDGQEGSEHPDDLIQSLNKMNLEDSNRIHNHQQQYYMNQNYGGQPMYNSGYMPGIPGMPELHYQNQFIPSNEEQEDNSNVETHDTSSNNSSKLNDDKKSSEKK